MKIVGSFHSSFSGVRTISEHDDDIMKATDGNAGTSVPKDGSFCLNKEQERGCSTVKFLLI